MVQVGAVMLLQILPTLIFVSSLTSVLYHFGNAEQKGDLYATADIQLPRSLSKDQRAAWEQIRKFESRN